MTQNFISKIVYPTQYNEKKLQLGSLSFHFLFTSGDRTKSKGTVEPIQSPLKAIDWLFDFNEFWGRPEQRLEYKVSAAVL